MLGKIAAMELIHSIAQHMASPPADLPKATMLFIALMLAVLVIVALWLILGKPSGAGGEPSCGSCGYLVRGLMTFQCPECGADLREVGINRQAATTRAGFAWKVAGWVVACQCVAMMLAAVANQNHSDSLETFVVIGGITLFATFVAGIAGLVRRRQATAPVVAAGTVVGGGAPGNGGAMNRDGPGQSRGTGVMPPPRANISRTMTIMFVDMVGFTTRGADASRHDLMELVRAVRQRVEPALVQRRGRIVKTLGDGMLVSFDSATDAVLAGVDIQREQAVANGGLAVEKRIELRIGISTGEVSLEGGDLFGEPVNLASRIEQAAPPGEVHFSESTWHAMTRSEVPHELLAEVAFKGIAGPVRLYRAVM